ncbi:unnamed protein product [Parascedosporium putredinis]|uniref:Cell morphogenesis protein PAG1 n=1 Tax=Parascedosporium putredinis TaxID=1442378 RepID=A0A9P1GUY3_9PEZI|nr:unnamed protein product [Parascedosporium putredinis]CAI7987813.1 unnamed protein product [Parascedosporium putredinis]
MIAAAGAAMLSDRPDFHGMLRIDDDVPLSRPGTSLSNAPTLTSISHASEKPTSIPESTSYSATTEEKLNDCITVPFDPEPHIEHICGPGADPGFDQSIIALGHIASQKPKPLIDLMMLWRKSKSDLANEARSHVQQSKTNLPPSPLQRRNTEPVQPHQPSSSIDAGHLPFLNSPTSRQEYVAQAERRSTVSIYILCRVLIEIISQSNLACITPEMEEKLEGIIFGQLKIADTEQLMMSPLKLANWNLFAQLLGTMSEISFPTVTKRFLSDIEHSLQELAIKGPSSAAGRDTEGKMELVLGGMKQLRIKVAPTEAWEQSCDFLIALGRLFNKSHGQRAKTAFCQVLDMLLIAVAAKASSGDFSHPKWAEVRSSIGPRLAQMFVKPRHWGFAFPLTATLLCVSTPDTFNSQWLQLVLPLQPKLKDRYTRSLSLQVVSRLLWTFLYRAGDSSPSTVRKLDEVIKLVLPQTKRSLIASEISVAEPLIQVIRIIGYKHPEYCFKSIIFPLINAELFKSNKELRVEQLDPDRIVIGIRAFLAIISDLEKEDGVSRPVLINALSDTVKEYYLKFCEILGTITIICDNTFGGQAALDEKFSSPGPKTPIADTFNFSRRDDHQAPSDQKQAFYELLHVAVQALPRCLSVDIPFNSIINLLCTGTAHVQSNIAESSAQSLKAIARQSHSQQVTMGFSRFIFNFDDRYSTMSDGGMLGPGHIDVWAEVDYVEAHGLFFLCSQSRRVRHFAVTVLRLITEFDTALGKTQGQAKDTLRLIDILENDADQVISLKHEQLSVAERSRLQRGLLNNTSGHNKGALVELCTSDVSYDSTLWFKILPNLMRVAFDKCPFTPEVVIEQWKLYLIFACTTLADPGSAPLTTPTTHQHGRKGSSKSNLADKIVSARTLFKYLIPMLSATSASVREAVVVAMGSINIHIYRTLLEELQTQVSQCNNEARARIHQRSNSNPRRNRKMDLLRTEITHVYKLTSHFLKEPEIYQDEWILSNLVNYTKDLKLFLMDGEVQTDWEFQKLRRHYCGLTEELFEGINRTKDPSRWMSFESRKSAFSLMEDWCGFSPNQTQIRAREDTMRQSLIDQQSLGERGTVTAAMEIEKRNLRTTALSAMAALCGGPISITTESGVILQFDPRRLLTWIEAIFNSGSDRMNITGRRALHNLIIHNSEYPYLLEHCIARCYLAEVPKVLESYFSVVSQVLLEHADYPTAFWKVLSLCLFTLGNDQSEIRSRSAHVLRALDERQQIGRRSKIQDFDISISDKTKAVYKLAQFEISKRLSKQHTDLAFHVFSEFTLYFKDLQPASQQNMVAVILPWIQAIALTLDPNGGPTAPSYVLLANLVEITIKASGTLHNEVQALWQALVTGPHPLNVRIVMDFIISLCLERREQNFVEYAKQIVVFLSSTPGMKVIDFLMVQITPKAMVPNEKQVLPAPPDVSNLPYCADLTEALPIGTKQAGFSLGQLSLILLVDLMVSPVHLSSDHLPVLLQVVTVLWDHYTPLVQEQAREMLIHLIHELVISKLADQTPATAKKSIEDLIDSIRRHDRAVVWSYEDSNGKADDRENHVPPSMENLTTEVVKTFELTFPADAGGMLVRLSNTIADEDPEIQTFSMEILTTLKTLIVKLDADKLATFPQLFWTTCACLESINELEFLEAVEMLNEYLAKLDFRSDGVRLRLMEGQPSRWDGSFDGLQPLLHKGMRSSLCMEPTLRTIDKLAPLPSDSLVGDDSRVFFAILSHLPGFLHALDLNRQDEETLRSARILAEAAECEGYSSVSHVLNEYVGSRYRSSKELLGHMLSALKDYFLPRLDFEMVTFCMGLLTNSTSWVKIKTMQILCVVIPEMDMRKPELAGHGSDLISPLLRLLQTEFCMEALEVLDNIMTMSGSSMDKHHLRMSMTRATSKAIRKEYERTQSLSVREFRRGYGRALPTPEVEFHSDDFDYGYLPPNDRTETMMSDDLRAESTMGDLVSKLDSLDDFFDDLSQSAPSEGRSSRTITEYDPDLSQSSVQVYDDQIVPILHQASNNPSFQNGFAERAPAMSREASSNTMNPGAFIASSASHRQGLPSRAGLSPSTPSQAQIFPGDLTSDDEFNEDVLSDADDEQPGMPGDESSFFLENMIRPFAQSSRPTARRLTGENPRFGPVQNGTVRTFPAHTQATV